MPVREINTKYYRFEQNNSGGCFKIDESNGIGPEVWIEAISYKDANQRAENIGIYFNGVDNNIDCSCCGDRWHKLNSENIESLITENITEELPKNGYWFVRFLKNEAAHKIYIHHIDQSIDKIKVSK